MPTTHAEQSSLPGSVLRFRTGAAMISRLGSEQLKDDITAVLELVKNSYDADATEVRVELQDLDEGQRLRIRDDGSGMTLSDLHTKWARVATENKVRTERSPRFRRPLLGQKGVGRFATEKLGKQLVLRTRTQGADQALQVKFDWTVLSPDEDLEHYEWPVKEVRPDVADGPHGTRLDIKGLRTRRRKTQTERLRAQLARLIDPAITADFRILFVAPWEELCGVLASPLAGGETHSIAFALQSDGTESVETSAPERQERHSGKVPAPIFGPIRGRLRYFRQGLRRSERGRGGETEADWNMGVRIFRDGCRVRPYGEPGPDGDWLEVFRTRFHRGGRFRLNPNYLEGTIQISKLDNPALRDTTSREALDENDAYVELVKYIQQKVLDLSDLVGEDEIREERSKRQQRYKQALEPLTAGLGQIKSDAYRLAVEDADKQVRKAIRATPAFAAVRNARWECLDCADAWNVPREKIPTQCREFSVGRDGQPSRKPGCGSTNVRRKENVEREEPLAQGVSQALDDVMSGLPAYVSGVQLKPEMDWNMGERDDEAEVRPDRRILAINGRHPAFRCADQLDGNATPEGTALDALRAVAALTMHVIDSACVAWARWHYELSEGQFDLFLARHAELKAACLSNITTKQES